MSWVSVSVELDSIAGEALADALLERGALSAEVTDADFGTDQETALYDEPGESNGRYWRRSRVSALFEAAADHRGALQAACRELGLTLPAGVQVRAVEEQDWVAATQRQFGPIRISERLWIVPSWSEPPVPAALNLRLDPGLAFGTGSHATTWQCLRWLEDHLRVGWSVLDYGCGSGILAIAAKKMGAGRVLGVDIDPNAIQASLANASRNDAHVEFALPTAASEDVFDVVVANILANPLRVLAPLLSAHTRPAGWIVLAGVLERQAVMLRDAYLPWVDLEPVSRSEGWTCLAGARRL